jgi:DNA-nicking Smr family endonuclease
MARRRLTAEEIELWQQVVQRTERMSSRPDEPNVPMPKPKPTKRPVSRIEGFDLGQAARPRPVKHDLKPGVMDRLTHAPVQMDSKAFGRMKRGKLKPEGRLDLHGMRIDNAHPALKRFILTAQASGKRLVLVITGKGKTKTDSGPIPTPRGVLKHQVPQWLSMPPLAQAVLQVAPAHISHGGEGAYYVYLRRPR